jgi:hypothetical protein
MNRRHLDGDLYKMRFGKDEVKKVPHERLVLTKNVGSKDSKKGEF